MSNVIRDYTLVLTITVKAEEDENDIDHDWLWEKLQTLFPTIQKETDGRKIEAEVTHRALNRNY